MFNSIKRGFGFTFGRILFYILLLILFILIGYFLKVEPSDLLMKVNAVELDNSIIATQWNKYYKNSSSSPSASTYFYANKTFLWSEQYSKFNWYMWETDYQLSDRLEMLKDYLTSRTWSDISDNNDIQFVISCGATFNNNQIHNKSTLIFGSCYIYPVVNGAGNMAVNEVIHRIEGTQSTTTSESTYVNIYNLYGMSIPSNAKNIYIEFSRQANSTSYYSYFNLTDPFFTTPIEDLDSFLPTLNYRTSKNTSGGAGMPLFSKRIYYQSVPKYNGILNTYYPFDTFLYQSDITPTFDTSEHTYFTLSNETITEQHCHIINNSNTCDNDFVFKSYYDYLNDGGEISEEENGNVDVTTTTQTEIDYTSNINSINSNITDPSINTSDVDDFLNDSNFNENQTVQNIVRIPLNFINNLTTSCQPFQLTLPFINLDISVPCISSTFSSKLGSIFQIVQIIINGFVIYRILMGFVDLVNTLKDPTNDKLEVIQL